MGIDWGHAYQVGGVGFGLVFVVLIFLAVVMWVSGIIIKKIESGATDAGEKKKGA